MAAAPFVLTFRLGGRMKKTWGVLAVFLLGCGEVIAPRGEPPVSPTDSPAAPARPAPVHQLPPRSSVGPTAMETIPRSCSGPWVTTRPMSAARHYPVATVLRDGRVL